MKKRIAIFTVLVAAMAALTACGDKIDAGKYVTLGEYTGASVTVAPKHTVTEEDVDTYINSELLKKEIFTEVSDRAVQEQDEVNIAFVGKKDGVEFEGGKTDSYDLLIGSNSFIPGFEEGLIGVKKGETVDLNLTFPEGYKSPELAGQPVVFTVTVNSIKALSELTDEIAVTLAAEQASDIKTAAAYKEFIKKALEESAQNSYDQSIQNAAFDFAYKNAKITEPPQEIVDDYNKINDENTNMYASYSSMSREDFITNSLGKTLEEFEQEKQKSSIEAAKQELAVRAIAKKEKLKVKESEINTFAKENMAKFGYTTTSELLEGLGKDEVEYYLLRQKVYEFIAEKALVTESEEGVVKPAEEPTSEEAPAEETAVSDNAAE